MLQTLNVNEGLDPKPYEGLDPKPYEGLDPKP